VHSVTAASKTIAAESGRIRPGCRARIVQLRGL